MATTKAPKRIMSQRQIDEMLKREHLVMTLRIRGKSFTWIEKTHGLHNADRIFKRAIAREENAPFARAEAIRLEEARLDGLQEGLWDKALNGDARAVEVVLKVLERRARLLGLDFADMVSGQLVEVERAKVKLMATALVTALNAIDATADQRRAATAAFLGELRTLREAPREDEVYSVTTLTDEDEALL